MSAPDRNVASLDAMGLRAWIRDEVERRLAPGDRGGDDVAGALADARLSAGDPAFDARVLAALSALVAEELDAGRASPVLAAALLAIEAAPTGELRDLRGRLSAAATAGWAATAREPQTGASFRALAAAAWLAHDTVRGAEIDQLLAQPETRRLAFLHLAAERPELAVAALGRMGDPRSPPTAADVALLLGFLVDDHGAERVHAVIAAVALPPHVNRVVDGVLAGLGVAPVRRGAVVMQDILGKGRAAPPSVRAANA